MSDGSSTRRARQRQSRPDMEALEARSLLSTTADAIGTATTSAADITTAATSTTTGSTTTGSTTTSTTTSGTVTTPANTPGALRRFDYTTPGGAKVDVQLFGVGTLTGTYVDPDGALNLRFSGTNEFTGIIGHVNGGRGGTVPLRSIEHLLIPAQSLSGIGSTLLNVVRLKQFNLVSGGRINLTGGVHTLTLNSVAANTQVSLRQIPESLTPTSGPSTASQNGVNYGFLLDFSGARTLTNVGGPLITGFSPLGASAPELTATGAPPAPPGVVISINHVNGPTRQSPSIGNPQVFAYDKTNDSLVSFDTGTGKPTLTIPNALHGNTAGEAGVALTRVNGALAVLVDDGSTVYAYNALTGAAEGSFSLAPLMAAPFNLANPMRLGTFDSFTVVGDPNGGTPPPGMPHGLGKLQAINVGLSLQKGEAVVLTDPVSGTPVVPSYTSQRAFQFTGGFAGLPGSSTLYAAGSGHFDPYQPDQFQLGVASLTPSFPTATSAGAGVTETNRGAVSPTTVTNEQGVTLSNGNLNNALGNIDESLALITGKGTDPKTKAPATVVTLYNASSLSKQTSVYLDTADDLTDLSGSFRPDLNGTALVDVQGNTQSFRAIDARGLVFNGEGNVNLVKMQSVADSTVIGFPLTHVQVPLRQNTLLISSTRSVGDRGGVTQVAGLSPTGPLSLP